MIEKVIKYFPDADLSGEIQESGDWIRPLKNDGTASSISYKVYHSAHGTIVYGHRFSTGEDFKITDDFSGDQFALTQAEHEIRENREEIAQVKKDIFRSVIKKLKGNIEREKATQYTKNKKIDPLHSLTPTKIIKHEYELAGKKKKIYITPEDTLIVGKSEGKTVTLQIIKPDGTKFFVPGSKPMNSYQIVNEVKSASQIYICEGYATAITIKKFKRTSTVINAFNMSNIKNVAEIMKKDNPNSSIVVCGERLANVEVRNFYNGLMQDHMVIIPQFKGDKGTDFNDLLNSEGEDEVKKQLGFQRLPETDMFPVPLGFTGNDFVVVSKRKNNIETFQNINKGNFQHIAPYSWFKSRFGIPNKDGDDKIMTSESWINASEAIIEECLNEGVYDASKTKTYGVFRDKEDLIFNNGSELYVINDDFKRVSKFDMKTKYFYAQRPTLYEGLDEAEPLNEEEKQLLLEAFDNAEFEEYQGGRKVLGWVVQGILAGVSKARAHMHILGERSTGKSFLYDFVISHLLPYNPTEMGGSCTEASFRQHAGSAALPFVADDIDASGPAGLLRIQAVTELHRVASFGDDRRVGRGDPSGTALSWLVRHAVLNTSIEHYLELDQDKDRFIMLHTKRVNKREVRKRRLATKEIMKKLGKNVGARFVKTVLMDAEKFLELYEENFELTSEREDITDHPARIFASVMAGYEIIAGRMKNRKAFMKDLNCATEPLEEADDSQSDFVYNVVNLIVPRDIVSEPQTIKQARWNPDTMDILRTKGLKVCDKGTYIDIQKSSKYLMNLYNKTYGIGRWYKDFKQASSSKRCVEKNLTRKLCRGGRSFRIYRFFAKDLLKDGIDKGSTESREVLPKAT